MTSFVTRLLGDDGGQDLVEYALLTAAVGLAAAATFSLLLTALAAFYGRVGVGVNGVSETPLPPGW